MGPRITLERVSYRYPKAKAWALQGVTLTLEPGRITAVIGPNGAGKTTLLALAGLLLEPVEGAVLVDGEPAGLEPWRHRIVFVPEKPILLRGTVEWNIALAPRLQGATRDSAAREAWRAAERLGIAHLLPIEANSLSRGQKTLAQIARALASKPQALLLDEPYATLDPEARRRLTRILREEASRGVTIAFTSHEALLVERVADHAILIVEGRIQAEGPPRRVIEEYLGE